MSTMEPSAHGSNNPVVSSKTSSTTLFVDLDGTLIKTDLLYESVARLLQQKPWCILFIPFWLFRGRAALKRSLAQRISLDVTTLPYTTAFLEWLGEEKRAGRTLWLATASDEILAKRVADHLGLFDGVLASDGKTNLKGRTKLLAIQEVISGEFDYAGNSNADLEIWKNCSVSILVGASSGLAKLAPKTSRLFSAHEKRSKIRRYLDALRIHQWTKNVLVFVPLITAHHLTDAGLVMRSAACFLAFSLCSSSQYLLNDMVDLEADRRHATKRHRRFATGDVPIQAGLVLAPLLLASGLGGALLLSPVLSALLAGYFLLSLTYSLRLKRAVLVDVFVLSSLYTTRILAGLVATGIELSAWLLSFSFFLFLSLGFIKRVAELQGARPASGLVKGRGYRFEDLPQINLFGVCSAFLSTVVFLQYLQSDRVRQLYRQPELLWLLSPIFLYWISRIWIVASRGNLHEDPIVFVLKDKMTYLIAAMAGMIMLVAATGWLENIGLR